MTWLLQLPPAAQQAYFEGPALKPPLGVKPDFANPPNQNSLGYGVLIAMPVIVTILGSAQIYSRILYHRKFAVETCVTLAALGAYATFLYYVWRCLLSPGIFVHQWNMPLKELPQVLYVVSAGSTVYGIVIMLLKVGILLQWVQFFVPAGFRDMFWWICHITICINVLFYTICTFIEIFGCSPRRRLWTPWVEGKCLDMPRVIIASSFVNFFSDIVILFLPQLVIWKLHMSPTKKVGAGALFAAGIFATVCAGMRIKSTFDFANSTDISYNVSALGLWCVGEMTAGFFVLCLPALPQLFKLSPWIQKFTTFLRSISGASTTSSQGQTGNSNRNWPRSKPRRAPDASLFTDTHLSKQSFVPLTDLSVSKSDMRENEKWV